MRISDWSSDVCSSDLDGFNGRAALSAPRFQMADCRVAGTRGLFNLMAVDRVVELDGRIRTIAASCGEVQAGRGAMLLSTSITETMDAVEGRTDAAVRRSEERRVGEGGVSTCRSRGAPVH